MGPQTTQSYRVVVAIDFGTSRSGYAMSFVNPDKRGQPDQVIGRVHWPGQPAEFPKTLTHILYGPDRTVVAWGFEARSTFARLRRGDEAAQHDFLKNFKMRLREPTDERKEPIMETPSGRKVSVLQVVSDYLRCMKEMALTDVEASSAGLLQLHEILWCLTIPAIWTDSEKNLMRRAAVQAGLITDSPHDAERLVLVLEPEAAGIHCVRTSKFEMPAGTSYMVVDCGGGTVDITVFEKLGDNGQLKELARGTGAACGSMHVDQQFQEFLSQRLSLPAVNSFATDAPVDYVEMMAQWERTKCSFNPADGHDIVYFSIPGPLYRLLSKSHPDVLDRLDKAQGGDDSSLHIPYGSMMGFFQPVIDGILHKIDEQFSLLDDRACDYMFLVGGFSTSPVLQSRVENMFRSQVKAIVTPPMPGAAIVQGAVTYGLQPSVMYSRKCRHTYGIRARMPFRDGIDPATKRVFSTERGVPYCNDRFCVFASAGSTVLCDERVLHVFHPASSTATSVEIEILATDLPAPEYADDPAVNTLGTLTVHCPDLTGGVHRDIDVALFFGRTEIKIEAHDKTTSRLFETTVEYTPTTALVASDNAAW